MVDLRSTSAKLHERSIRILTIVTGMCYEDADNQLVSAKGSVKRAIVMARLGVTAREADRLLTRANGFVFRALGEK
jgi:N-acetylmuramic acid 6-phosphate (MurNAc-6-P) etherase